jgi:hypothetical protein
VHDYNGDQWMRELAKAMPSREYMVEDVSLDEQVRIATCWAVRS